jgi:hypothetical protein
MSEAPKDGGQAFPQMSWEYDGQNNVLQFQYPGMTLRDYFAAKAMQAVVSSVEWDFNGKPMDAIEVTDAALMSYQLADAMLKARQS